GGEGGRDHGHYEEQPPHRFAHGFALSRAGLAREHVRGCPQNFGHPAGNRPDKGLVDLERSEEHLGPGTSELWIAPRGTELSCGLVTDQSANGYMSRPPAIGAVRLRFQRGQVCRFLVPTSASTGQVRFGLVECLSRFGGRPGAVAVEFLCRLQPRE